MGRPSLAALRREQILDAYESLLPAHGIAVSFKRIAEAAGVSPSIINHYFGSRRKLNRAVFERIHARHRALFRKAGDKLRGRARLDALLQFMFGGEWSKTAQRIYVVLELLAQTSRNTEARKLMCETFLLFESVLDEQLEEAFPHSSRVDRQAVAYSLMCLGRANEQNIAVGIDRNRSRRALAAANVWVSILENSNPNRTDKSGSAKPGATYSFSAHVSAV
ncbi:MAG: TetR/AcrR family transcriptional regulator [Candidatus Binatia bacterium]